METRSLKHDGTAYVIEVEEMTDPQGKREAGTFICRVYSPETERSLAPKGQRDAPFVRRARSAKALLTELEDEILTNSLELFDPTALSSSATTGRH